MTIFALATAPGRAAIAVIRVSGPAAGETVRYLTGRDLPAARQAVLRRLQDRRSGESIDQSLILWFPAPDTVTGEDVAEFHVHGGRAVVHGVLDALAAVPGVRPAEPGEFTRRAVLNGKMDLVEAEAVADLVAADTSRQRHQALGQLQGFHSAVYDGWRQRLVDAMARLEAVIDFPDEELPAGLLDDNAAAVTALEDEVRAHLDDARRGERLREGLSVVILGAPNVGKSSLLNALAGNDAAIVSAEAGTTRDTVEVTMDIAGFAVSLVDTAGLREVPQGVEGEGIRRALKRARTADLTLLVADSSRWDETWPRIEPHCDGNALVVAGKADLALPPPGVPGLSTKTGEGIDRLIDAMAQRFRLAWQGAGLSPSRARHRAALLQVADALARYRDLEAGDVTLAAEDLRLAATALGRLTGRVDVEDLLDVIFSEFCIGK
ncbi:MAG: tRNA uridine-5-carboxymethylaminomethyl(34) synthesis GTPase MnmE [bacterium]|nr:tRNA uridine-5-carboxymethylaminomethyl(34) synthesis GTPase MnmE [bacterium]